MKNANLFNAMIDRYNDLSFTHNYIYGFTYKKMVYMVKADNSVMPFVLTLDEGSRGAGFSLRFKPNNSQKLLLISKGAQILCSQIAFENAVKESKYNRGEIFEKMVTEYNGQEWEKDNVPFTDDGDLTVDGIAYQIKFEKASFTSEKQLARL
jgi:hypothetical protein